MLLHSISKTGKLLYSRPTSMGLHLYLYMLQNRVTKVTKEICALHTYTKIFCQSYTQK